MSDQHPTTTMPTIGAIHAPEFTAAATRAGITVIGGSDFRSAAAAIVGHSKQVGAMFPIVVGDFDDLSLETWISAVAHSAPGSVGFFRNDAAPAAFTGGLPEGISQVALTATVNDVLRAISSAPVAGGDITIVAPTAPVFEAPFQQVMPDLDMWDTPTPGSVPAPEAAPVAEEVPLVVEPAVEYLPEPEETLTVVAPAAEPVHVPAPVAAPLPVAEPLYVPQPVAAPVEAPIPIAEPVHVPAAAPVAAPLPVAEPVYVPQPVAVPVAAPVDDWDTPIGQAPAVTPQPVFIVEPQYTQPAPAPVYEPAPVQHIPAPVQQPVAPAPVYQQPVAPVQLPAAPVYQQQPAAPTFEQVIAPVQPPAAPVYEQPAAPVYAQPVNVAPAWDTAPVQEYQQPIAAPQQQQQQQQAPEPRMAPAPDMFGAVNATPGMPMPNAAQYVAPAPVQPVQQAPLAADPWDVPVDGHSSAYTFANPANPPRIDNSHVPVVTHRPNTEIAGLFDGYQPSNWKGKVLTSFSGKGGVGKTTMTIQLARCAAAAGLKVIVIDGNVGQGDILQYLRLNTADMPTIYDIALRTQSGNLNEVMRNGVIQPETANQARRQSDPDLDNVEFAIIAAAPSSVEDHRLVTNQLYNAAIDFAARNADLVILDTQIIESGDRTNFVGEVILPLMRHGAYGVGISEAGVAGANNLLDRLTRLSNEGIERRQLMALFNKVSEDGIAAAQGSAEYFSTLGTYVGHVPHNNDIQNDMNRGTVHMTDPALNATLNRVLFQVLGDRKFEEAALTFAAESEPKRRTKFSLFKKRGNR